jgi:hypothetical protein
MPGGRPLVGPRNTSHALDGPQRRPRSRSHTVAMKNLGTTLVGVAVALPPQVTVAGVAVQLPPLRMFSITRRYHGRTPRRNKKPQGQLGLGVRFFCGRWTALREPYGRRSKSARNNKANRFRRTIIPILYMTRVSRSSSLPLGQFELQLRDAPRRGGRGFSPRHTRR